MYHKIDVSNFTVEQADDFAWFLSDELGYEVVGDSTFGYQHWKINSDGPCVQHILSDSAVYIRHIGRMYDVDRNNLIANVTRLFFEFGLSLAQNNPPIQNDTQIQNVRQFRFLS